MAETPSRTPFTIIDDADVLQKIVVVPTGSGSDTQIIGYAYTELTGSSFEIVDDILTYVKQDVRFNRATHVYSAVFNSSSIFEERANIIEVYEEPALNPHLESVTQTEEQITKAIDVVIQNSTNKIGYLKVSYDPEATVSDADYTVKIPPGVIYNSEQKVAHMRHKLFYKSLPGFEGEVSIAVVYNNNLNDALSTGNDPLGTTELSTLATNVYDLPFNAEYSSVINEWVFSGQSIYNLLKVSGQARVTQAGQELHIWITTSGSETPIASSVITSVSPAPFILTINNPQNNTYELIASASGTGDIGDARILFADLIKTNTSLAP